MWRWNLEEPTPKVDEMSFHHFLLSFPLTLLMQLFFTPLAQILIFQCYIKFSVSSPILLYFKFSLLILFSPSSWFYLDSYNNTTLLHITDAVTWTIVRDIWHRVPLQWLFFFYQCTLLLLGGSQAAQHQDVSQWLDRTYISKQPQGVCFDSMSVCVCVFYLLHVCACFVANVNFLLLRYESLRVFTSVYGSSMCLNTCADFTNKAKCSRAAQSPD